MCCGPDPSTTTDSTTSAPGFLSRRPTGSRRRQLEWLTNFFLVVVSLFGISVGSGLLVFYKLQLLSFISAEFAIVPAVLLVGGCFTLFVSVVGLVATSRRSPILLACYACLLFLAFLVLVAGIVCSVRIIFIIFMGMEHYVRLSVPLVKKYGSDAFATETWDSLHETYRCCGAETSFDLGYMVWEKNEMLQLDHAVPDSCCLERELGCGKRIFELHDLEKMSHYVKKIHVHGCIHAMENVLKDHVVPILTIFSISGSILAMIELLGVVLACCLAQAFADEHKDRRRESALISRREHHRSDDRITAGSRLSMNRQYNDTSL